MSMVTGVRLSSVEDGLEAVLSRKQRAPICDGEKEARLTEPEVFFCSIPPTTHPLFTEIA